MTSVIVRYQVPGGVPTVAGVKEWMQGAGYPAGVLHEQITELEQLILRAGARARLNRVHDKKHSGGAIWWVWKPARLPEMTAETERPLVAITAEWEK
jgi:hypothetical protein